MNVVTNECPLEGGDPRSPTVGIARTPVRQVMRGNFDESCVYTACNSKPTYLHANSQALAAHVIHLLARIQHTQFNCNNGAQKQNKKS